jgi:dolichol kinase
MRIITGYLFSYLYVTGILVAVYAVKKLSKAESDIFRKSVHVAVAFTWLILCKYLYGTWHFVIMPLTLIVILAVCSKEGLLKIIERENNKKKDFGIFHYAISTTLICAVAQLFPAILIPCGIGVFALSFGDGAASIFGEAFRKTNLHITKTKTLAGTVACFIFAIIGTLVLKGFVPFQISIVHLLIIGVVAAFMEVIGGHYDNYSVPFGVVAIAVILMNCNVI